jgi:FKBP-type peptidyl-prolyl cis-trans isomerase
MKQTMIIIGIVLAITGLTWWILETMDVRNDKGNKNTGAPDVEFKFASGGLKMIDVTEGTGRVAKAGDTVTVHYTGRLANGKKFDSSVDRNEPFKFKLGAREVIQGWDQGVAGMKEGGKRKLIIPPELGYGATGAGPDIPPNAELHFDVELLSVR